MRTAQDLRQKQALPLPVKVKMTQTRIREWVNHFGKDGVAVSFSGGKDSTVLLHLVRDLYPGTKAVFFDTGLEYPEIRDFVKGFKNVDWIKPKKTFRQVISDYGYPFISKEVSERVYYAQKYLTWYAAQKHASQTDRQTDRQTDAPSAYGVMDLAGVPRKSDLWREIQKTRRAPNEILERFADSKGPGSYKIRELTGKMEQGDGNATQFDYRPYMWVASCPYIISHRCCAVMKKGPAHTYGKKTGKAIMTGQMAQESRLRTMQWMNNGCNGFSLKLPTSNPMAFWTEQDVLRYIKENGIQIASVYGDVVYTDEDGFEYADSVTGTGKLKTTGCKRTGCVFCGYGAHLEKPGDGRFERLKVTHTKLYEYIFRDWDKGGLGYKQVIDWLNEHGNLNIRY